MTYRFDHVIVLINPASTGKQQIKMRIEELRALIPSESLDIIMMTSKDREATSDILIEKSHILGSNTLLGIAAGDGTTSVIVETLIRDKRLPKQARLTVIIPLWGGNANDLANMLNGSASSAKLHTIITKGNVIPIYPLQFDITQGNISVATRIAVCNASFGATAYVAIRLNDSRFRKSKWHQFPGGRLLKETTTAVTSLLRAPTFEIEDNGVRKIIYERMFSNGSRFAKIYQMPVELNDKQFYVNTIEGKRLFIIFALLLSGSFNRFASENSLKNAMKFTLREETQAQFDGETLKIPPNTNVAARLSKRPVYALTTQLLDE